MSMRFNRGFEKWTTPWHGLEPWPTPEPTPLLPSRTNSKGKCMSAAIYTFKINRFQTPNQTNQEVEEIEDTQIRRQEIEDTQIAWNQITIKKENRYPDKIATSCGYPDEQNHITVKKIIDTQIRQQDMAVTQMIKFKGGKKREVASN